MVKRVISKILRILDEEDGFLITSHIRPDGDAVASQLAFAHLLKRLGKRYKIINEEPIPSLFSFLPSSSEFSTPFKGMDPFRVAIILDCHEVSRLGEGVSSTIQASSSIVVVDHHPGRLEFEALALLSQEASSTCELLYELINLSRIKIDHPIALCLYTGIFTDTGGFAYANTGSRTHMIAAHLLRYGIEVEKVWSLLNRVERPEFIKLTSIVLATLKIEEGGIAHLTMRREIDKECGVRGLDFEADYFLRHIRPIKGVKVCILFREIDKKEVRVSMRTSSLLDMNKIARRFGGGGHPQAAGCVLHTSIKEAKNMVIEEIKKELR